MSAANESNIKPIIWLPEAPNCESSAKVAPAYTWIKFKGINPKNVVLTNIFKGIPAIGLATFTSIFGTSGVILTNKE